MTAGPQYLGHVGAEVLQESGEQMNLNYFIKYIFTEVWLDYFDTFLFKNSLSLFLL